MASTYLSLNVHVVFATKDRAPTIADAWRKDLHAYISGTISGLGATPFAVGGVADHVHLLAGLKATHSLADFVREIKKSSSIWASERCRAFAWQAGYGAFSVGHGEMRAVAKYIADQEVHHRKLSSAEEIAALLAEFEVAYDKRFFE